MLVVVSCGDRVPTWRRTELDLRSCKPFDDQHRPTTFGAKPSIARTGGGYLYLGLWCRAEQLKAKWQSGGTPEAIRKQVQQEATEEFIERESHQALFVLVNGVAPAEGDLLLGKRDQAMVGDGHAMGVTAQITEHMLWAPEWAFRIDHPILSEQWSEPRSKGFRLSEELQVSMKGELAVLKSALECLVELAAKDSAEHLDGKKEVVAWFDPARVIDRQAAGGHYAMYMRVKFEFLTPAVQHAEEANLCAKMFGIAGNFEECFCTGSEQEIVDDFLVLQNQRSQMTRKCEDHMHVLRRKKFPATLFQPTFASSCLTLRAVAIST